ncbi:MAG: hypothetical protein HQK99_09600 [Nitrospirae bacterium]|nr:hypothetical protein [Nitrospirota bacterium]
MRWAEQCCDDLDVESEKEPLPSEGSGINDIKYLILTGKGKTRDIRRVILNNNII